jgi:tetratricopeptide (TPR) repeat protein
LYAENKYGDIAERCRQMMARFEHDGHVFTRGDSMCMSFIVSARANALKTLGRGGEAIQIYMQVLGDKAYENLGKWYFYWSLGSLHRDDHNYLEAKECYLKALADAPAKSKKGIQEELDNLPSIQ